MYTSSYTGAVKAGGNLSGYFPPLRSYHSVLVGDGEVFEYLMRSVNALVVLAIQSQTADEVLFMAVRFLRVHFSSYTYLIFRQYTGSFWKEK